MSRESQALQRIFAARRKTVAIVAGGFCTRTVIIGITVARLRVKGGFLTVLIVLRRVATNDLLIPKIKTFHGTQIITEELVKEWRVGAIRHACHTYRPSAAQRIRAARRPNIIRVVLWVAIFLGRQKSAHHLCRDTKGDGVENVGVCLRANIVRRDGMVGRGRTVYHRIGGVGHIDKPRPVHVNALVTGDRKKRPVPVHGLPEIPADGARLGTVYTDRRNWEPLVCRQRGCPGDTDRTSSDIELESVVSSRMRQLRQNHRHIGTLGAACKLATVEYGLDVTGPRLAGNRLWWL